MRDWFMIDNIQYFGADCKSISKNRLLPALDQSLSIIRGIAPLFTGKRIRKKQKQSDDTDDHQSGGKKQRSKDRALGFKTKRSEKLLSDFIPGAKTARCDRDHRRGIRQSDGQIAAGKVRSCRIQGMEDDKKGRKQKRMDEKKADRKGLQ